MALTDVIAQIDAEIAKLQQARALLSESTPAVVPAVKKSGRGRPKGSKNASKSVAVEAKPAPAAKRQLSPEGRKAIADAMKRRWAERRKAAAK